MSCAPHCINHSTFHCFQPTIFFKQVIGQDRGCTWQRPPLFGE